MMKQLNNIKFIHSGGAKGSDTIFSDLFSNYKHIIIIHHSFNHHNIFCESGKFSIHPDNELFQHRMLLKILCKQLKRNYPTQEYIEKLLLRNTFQLMNSKLVIGVGQILNFENCIVNGGTGYAIKLAYMTDLPILFLNQENNKWYYSNNGNGFKELNRLPNINSFPDSITAIGTRNITEQSVNCLKQLIL